MSSVTSFADHCLYSLVVPKGLKRYYGSGDWHFITVVVITEYRGSTRLAVASVLENSGASGSAIDEDADKKTGGVNRSASACAR